MEFDNLEDARMRMNQLQTEKNDLYKTENGSLIPEDPDQIAAIEEQIEELKAQFPDLRFADNL